MANKGRNICPSVIETAETRLWVGNIDILQVSECDFLLIPLINDLLSSDIVFFKICRYDLLQTLRRFGELSAFEWVCHTQGPRKGEPRGYAFAAYVNFEVCLAYVPLRQFLIN